MLTLVSSNEMLRALYIPSIKTHLDCYEFQLLVKSYEHLLYKKFKKERKKGKACLYFMKHVGE